MQRSILHPAWSKGEGAGQSGAAQEQIGRRVSLGCALSEEVIRQLDEVLITPGPRAHAAFPTQPPCTLPAG